MEIPISELKIWQPLRVEVDFDIPNGQVRAGDYTIIELPEELISFRNSNQFRLNRTMVKLLQMLKFHLTISL